MNKLPRLELHEDPDKSKNNEYIIFRHGSTTSNKNLKRYKKKELNSTRRKQRNQFKKKSRKSRKSRRSEFFGLFK